jgi:polysaccharide export outer membrane protein
MTLGDALKNAGGLKIEAENLRLEISRLNYFSDNYLDGQEVRVIVEKIQLSSNEIKLSDDEAQIIIQPFDQIFVRAVPNFEAQQNIIISGEVKYPGVYPLLNKDERLDDIIKRAGGLTKFAFPESATLYREGLTGGNLVMNLDKALKSHNDKYNYVLCKGDKIDIPKVTDFVTIEGSSITYITIRNKPVINAPFVKGKHAKYYINEFGNGFTKESWRKKTYVIQPNAKVNRTKDFLIFKIYPKVTKGSTIYVVNKIKNEKDLKKDKEPFNWNKFVENTTLKITGLATFFLIFKQISL